MIGSACSLKRGTSRLLPGSETADDSTDMLQSEKTSSSKSADAATRNQFIAEYKANIGEKYNRPVYKKYLPILGVGAILDYLEQNPYCHGEAHNLGKELYAQTRNISQSLSLCGSRCTGGCMHGVLVEAFGDQSYEEWVSTMDGFCQSKEMLRDHKPGNCAHAMGHALMLSNNGDLAGSLKACDEFKQPGMDYYCATGVYMQYQVMLQEGKSPYDERLLSTVCGKEERFPAACYRYMLRVIRRPLGDDRERLIATCLSQIDIRHQSGCFHGLGNLYFPQMLRRPVLLAEICGHRDAEIQALCIEGAIEKLADFDSVQAERLCSTLTGNNLETCMAATRHKMYSLDKPTMKLYRPLEKDASGASVTDTKN